MGISLWLVPNEETTKKIETAMKLRPPVTQSPSSFLSFQPHVTLASSSDPVALRAASSSSLPCCTRPLQITRSRREVLHVGLHRRSFSPGSPLETLREHLRASLGEGAVPPVAHLSLYYINDADKEERENTARRLKSELRVLEGGTRRRKREEQDPELIDGFMGEEVWMVRCEGPVPGWEVMEKIVLAK
ncbi:hypothetical protein C8T65DRAFT_627177 [Cerioporus squamosus]|nr:hypothetical protein C8T65DRAFT_627177 [Cerioporus squamosus]